MITRPIPAWVAGIAVVVLLISCQGSQRPAATPLAASTAPVVTTPPDDAAERYSTLFIQAPSLRDNQIGESDKRALRVYLPPSYFTTDARYPVIYYLPGFTDTAMLGVSLPNDADALMRQGAIQEMIIVVANGVNRLGGSFYVNSPAIGRWEDFIVSDVVTYVDAHYRTQPHASARAISGHSMGGFGAINIGMRHPDVFSVVYSLSPGLFDPDGLAESQMFSSERAISRFIDYSQRLEALPVEKAERAMLSAPDAFTLAYGLAFAPNVGKHPPYVDYPYSRSGDNLVRDAAIWQTWDAGFGGIPAEIQQYRENLLRLNGLAIDYGSNDAYAWIPKGCAYFGEQLSAASIPHELRMHKGDHESRLGERIRDSMLPFISERLAAD